MELWEKETIINFNYEDATAYIFTYNVRWQSHIEARLGCKPTRDNGHGGKDYEIPKKFLRLPRAPRKLSEETKKRLAQNLAKSRRKLPVTPNTQAVVAKEKRKPTPTMGRRMAT